MWEQVRSRVSGVLVLVLIVVSLGVLIAGAPPNQYRTADVTRTVFASAARTVTANSDDFEIDPTTFKGVLVFLHVAAASGTLDVSLERKDPISGTYLALASAAFPQVTTATGPDTLVVYPGIAETANETVSDVGSGTLRAVATLGNSPAFTFSLAAVPLR